MPADRKWPAFDCAAWLKAQIGCLVTAELVTVQEARDAAERLASDDRFWGILEPVMHAMQDAVGPIADSAIVNHETAERHRRGLS